MSPYFMAVQDAENLFWLREQGNCSNGAKGLKRRFIRLYGAFPQECFP